MPPFPAAPGVAKITMTFLCSDRNFGDSFYVAHPGGVDWTDADLTAIATETATAWTTHMAPITASTCALVQVTALDLSDSVGRIGIFTGTSPGAVTTSSPLPLQAVAKITWQIARRYRGGRPGINVSGRVFGELADERSFTDADADIVLNATVAMIAQVVAFVGAGCFQCAVSYVADKVVRAVPLVLPVIGAEIQQRVCTLRKRLGKGIADLLG